jgi:NADPH-dependent 2,4-dienoyl-CoA reductase/sulfur reductase-like enzyme
MTLTNDCRVLIVGAGLAGYHTARGLRLHGHTGPILVIGEETRPAYDRPALSKAYLTGACVEEDLRLDDPENPLDVTWVSGTGVVGLSRDPLGVSTSDGAFHPADAVVITTGASASTLPPTSAEPGSYVRPYVLRSMEDALALRDASLHGADVAVVGGGFLALETAATCVGRGAESVTVVAGEELPGQRRLGRPVAEAVRLAHEARGVRFAPASRAASVSSRGTGDGLEHEILLENGARLTAHVVICAIGAVPRTEWLRDSDLTLTPDTSAVLCDDTGATGIPGVYAAGDCAQWASHSSGLRPVGHWQEAVEEAAVVAAALTGARPVPLQEPYFWSDQFDLRIQGAGRIHSADRHEVLEGSPEEGNLLVRYLRDGEETGILGINRLRDVKCWRKRRRITAEVAEVAGIAGAAASSPPGQAVALSR